MRRFLHKAVMLCCGAVLVHSNAAGQDNFPFAPGTLDAQGDLESWSWERVRNHRDATIGNLNGLTKVHQKDNAADPTLLGYASQKVEGKNFETELDLTNAKGLFQLAIHVDDKASLELVEIPAPGAPEGSNVIGEIYFVDGTALWNKQKSYKEFTDYLPTGRKYKLRLTYRNTANLTDRHPDGFIDYDGVNVFIVSNQMAVEKVQFDGGIQLTSDTGAPYNTWHYVDSEKNAQPGVEEPDGNADFDLGAAAAPDEIKIYPYAYASNTKARVKAKFWTNNLPANQEIWVQGVAINQESNFKLKPKPLINSEYTWENGDSNIVKDRAIQYLTTRNRNKFWEGEIASNPVKIKWEARLGAAGDKWFTIGTTEHTIYVTWDQPDIPNRQETVFNISCRKADGMTMNMGEEDAVFNAIWTQFKKPDLQVKRCKDGQVMKYWGVEAKNQVDAGNQQPGQVSWLLGNADGTCEAWMNFFADCLEAQKLPGVSRSTLQLEFLNFVGDPNEIDPGDRIGHTLFVEDYKIVNGKGVLVSYTPGQGNPEPEATQFDFKTGGHCVVYYNNKIWDPSYGIADKTPEEWETEAVGLLFYEEVGPGNDNIIFDPNGPAYKNQTFIYVN